MNGPVLAYQCLVGFMLVSVVFVGSCIDRAPAPLTLSEIRQQIVGKWYVSDKFGKTYKISEFLPDGQVIDRILAADGTPGPLMTGRYVIPATDLIQFVDGYLTTGWSLRFTRQGVFIRDEKYERVSTDDKH